MYRAKEHKMTLDEAVFTVECAWPERVHSGNQKLIDALGKVFHTANTSEVDIIEICELIDDRFLSHFVSGQHSVNQ